MSRLGDDSYKRPKKTLTDKLSAEEIKEKLEDYIEVEDISKVPLNTHIRYFTEKEDKDKKKKIKVFRLGGFLVNKNNYDKYVILSNVPDTGVINANKKTWSVNTKTSIFYRKQNLDEIKEQYQDELDELYDEVDNLKKQIKKLKAENTKLKNKKSN
tara:strand:+ start:3695 stop:4162 length:468 start_codon:yes stop_codon:yes gene_type:complete